MTRFARAKGSKASNERLPESSTPWHVMKEDMKRVQQEKEDSKERQKIDKVRQENYNNFLKEQKSDDVKNEWADFPDSESNTKKKDNKMVKGVEKAKNKKEKKAKISKEEVKEMLRPDPEIDSKVEKLTTKIDKILKKEESNKKTPKKQSAKNDLTNGTQEESVKPEKTPKEKKQKKNKQENTQANDDDAPMEVSAKVEVTQTPKNVSKKSKKKQTPLKIESVKKSDNESQNSPTKSENKVTTIEPTQNDSKPTETNDGEKPQNLTKSMKKRLMKKKKLAAQRLLNPKPELPEPAKKKPKPKKQKKPKAEGDEANQDSTNNEKDNNSKFGDRKRKFGSEENGYEKPNKFPRKPMKVAKLRDNLEHKRRKPDDFANGPVKMHINGLEFEIVKFEGFPVKKEDADRLHQLRRQMISKGIPRSEVKRTLQLERRKAEKALAREKKKVCFQCRKAGHVLSECPELNNEITSGTGICFKCGSTEHTHFECKVNKGEEFKFASCFICREQGHIARQCPDNPKGLYPQGGGCRICGDVTHLKKDCPQLQQENSDNASCLNTISSGNLEVDETETEKLQPKPMPVKNKVIKF